MSTRAGGSEPSVVVLDSAESLAGLAAELLAGALRDAVAERGVAHVATTGGSMAPALYHRLAVEPIASMLPWSGLRLWWGDDRFVPRTSPDSNVRAADTALSGLLAPSQIRPFPVDAALADGHDTAWCAARYAETLCDELPRDARGLPIFDVILLGVGPDGHCLSIFPDVLSSPPEVAATAGSGPDAPAITVAVPAPAHIGPHLPRVSLAFDVLDAARLILVMAAGAPKAEVLGAIFGRTRNEHRWPAQRARRAGAVWLLDEAAAARLPR